MKIDDEFYIVLFLDNIISIKEEVFKLDEEVDLVKVENLMLIIKVMEIMLLM